MDKRSTFNSLGDRMKFFEQQECNRILMPTLPTLARIDGRSFHTFTKGMKRPFDETMHAMMVDTTKYLVKHTQANIGYTQSDEITLMWYNPDPKSQIFFNGKLIKMVSALSAMASVAFNQLVNDWYTEHAHKLPTFDARVWQVPNINEAQNVFLWRERDCTKNSISMAAQSMFSHKQLHGKHGNQMLDMMITEKQVNWNDYPSWCKRGSYIKKINKQFVNEQGPYIRSQYDRIEVDPITEWNEDLIQDMFIEKALNTTYMVDEKFDRSRLHESR